MKSFLFPVSSAAMLLGVLQTASAASFDPVSGMVSLTKVDAGSLGSYSVAMRYVSPFVVLQNAMPATSAASADASFSATTGSLLIPALSVGTAKYKLSLQQVAGSFDFNITGLDFANAYPLVDTGQSACYDATSPISCPQAGASFYGQDAQFAGTQPSYTKSGDGLTVTDNITGLTWQQSSDTTGDGTIDANDKLTWTQTQARPSVLNATNYGGYNDWRLPTIKELYSLMNFMGTDVGPGSTAATLTPFIDRNYFSFGFGDTTAGERLLDAQYASSNLYVSKTMMALEYGVSGDETLFGVNFADGRIKGYGLSNSFGGAGEKTFYVRLVRGAAYGVNDFVDNGDSTITDRATGLMWLRDDSGKGMNWQDALAWAQTKNAENYLGHNDWRLPNAKELQAIVDYTRSPDTTSSAAINPLFTCTSITNEAGKTDYPYYWTNTTHILSDGTGAKAVYIAFGRALGYMTSPTDSTKSAWVDAHGAGAQRSDPKVKDSTKTYPYADGPQGDAIRVNNYVRLVRG